MQGEVQLIVTVGATEYVDNGLWTIDPSYFVGQTSWNINSATAISNPVPSNSFFTIGTIIAMDPIIGGLVETAVEWFSPYAHILTVIGYGNHETSAPSNMMADCRNQLHGKVLAQVEAEALEVLGISQPNSIDWPSISNITGDSISRSG